MNSSVKNGFSTLNRLLGKHKKNTTLSKSTSDLSLSMKLSNTDSSSQHNKIIPLTASSNVPFEQTFRITICLPRNQLYVVRIGAKTKLKKLLELVCANKQLDPDKYEFCHPSNNMQVFDFESSIGEVGLSEITLSLKGNNNYKEKSFLSYDKYATLESNRPFNQMRSTSSPYSSTISLNSIDSMNGTSNQNTSPPIVPFRKKRMAPRPPNRSMIISEYSDERNSFSSVPTLTKRDFFVSSPNVTSIHETKVHSLREFNNNVFNQNNTTLILNQQEQEQKDIPNVEIRKIPPEPMPRKRLIKKKAPPPPAFKDTPPVAPPRNLQKIIPSEQVNGSITNQSDKENNHHTITLDNNCEVPQNKPIVIETNSVDNNSNELENEIKSITTEIDSNELKHLEEIKNEKDEIVEIVENIQNETKEETVQQQIQINNEHQTSSDTIENSDKIDFETNESEISNVKKSIKNSIKIDDSSNYEYDIPIKVNIKERIPVDFDSLTKCFVEDENVFSSDVEDGYRIDKSKSIDEEIKSSISLEQVKDKENSKSKDISDEKTTDTHVSQSSISVDQTQVENDSKSEYIAKETVTEIVTNNDDVKKTDVIDELTDILSNNKVNTLINPMKQNDEIECSKQIVLSNFSIKSYNTNIEQKPETQSSITDNNEAQQNNRRRSADETYKESKSYKRFGDRNIFKSPKIVRSDSFQTTKHCEFNKLDPNMRSSSFASLQIVSRNTEIVGKSNEFNRSMNDGTGKSTSELSIADLPSLQSLLVMKSILSNSFYSNVTEKKAKSVSPQPEPMKIEPEIVKKENTTSPEVLMEVEDDTDTVELRKVNEVSKESEVNKCVPEEPKKWKYHGAPSINLSSWKDRPKSQIIIKSDSDYIFGDRSSSIKSIKEKFETNTKTKVEPKVSDSNNSSLPVVCAVEYKKNFKELDIRRSSYDVATYVTLDKSKNKPNYLKTSSVKVDIKQPQDNVLVNINNSQTNTIKNTIPMNSGISNGTDNKKNSVTVCKPSDGFKIETKTSTKEVILNVSKPLTVQSNRNVTNKPLNHMQGKSNESHQTVVRSINSINNQIINAEDNQMSSLNKNTVKSQQFDRHSVSDVNDCNAKTNNQASLSIARDNATRDVLQNSMPNTIQKQDVRAAPVIRSVLTKNKLIIPVDPRDQFLDSIRSFNRDKLKKSN